MDWIFDSTELFEPINVASIAVLISFLGLILLIRLIKSWNKKEAYIEKGRKPFSVLGILLLQIPILLVCYFKPSKTVAIPPYGQFDYTSEPFSFTQLGHDYLFGIIIIIGLFVISRFIPIIRNLLDWTFGE